ncbi:MAG: holo-ACP synthase, partial [Algiphilus sp.]
AGRAPDGRLGAATMLCGVGVDLVSVARFRALLARRGSAFAQRILHDSEWLAHQSARDPARDLAKRWAVKEAYAKALRTGFSGIYACDIALHRDPDSGAPSLLLSERGRAFAERCGAGQPHVSVSDEGDQIIAMVALERRRAPS